MHKLSSMRYIRLATFVLGSMIVSAWTIFRFFTQASSFDLLGQQVLAHQWLHGMHSASAIGSANYILKMLFIYMPFDVLPGSPRLKLIIMTLLINIATFILICIALEMLWKHFFPYAKINKLFYLALLWLSLLSGSVYWTQFSNSRNLEVAAGVFLITAYLLFAKLRPWHQYILLFLFTALLFFSDPLQIYMTSLPAILFLVFEWFSSTRTKQTMMPLLLLIAISILGILGSRLLFALVHTLAGVQFYAISNHLALTVTSVFRSARLTIKELASLYSGGAGAGFLRQLINLSSGVVLLAMSVWVYFTKKASRSPLILIAIIFIVNIALYILSDQALIAGTSRYLIMTVPAFIFLVIIVLQTFNKNRYIYLFIGLILAFNVVSLAYAASAHWDSNFKVDKHISAAEQYMASHKFPYGYASMDTSMAADYYSNESSKLLPLSCLPSSKVKPADLFFDTGAFNKIVNTPAAQVPFILDYQVSITNAPAVCNATQIAQQLGPWQRIDKLSDGSEALIYNANSIKEALHQYKSFFR